MADRDRGRETSVNLTEARTVLSRAENALGLKNTKGWAGRSWETLQRDEDYDEIRADLLEVVRILSKYRRTGPPRKT